MEFDAIDKSGPSYPPAYEPPVQHQPQATAPGSMYSQQEQGQQIPQMVHTTQPQHNTVLGNTVIHVGYSRPQGGQPQNIRDWDTGLCGCFSDSSTCCFGMCCPCCLLCVISTDMGEGCAPACFCPGTTLVTLRNQIRTQHGIRGSLCKDICAAMCCTCCAVCQVRRQIIILHRQGH